MCVFWRVHMTDQCVWIKHFKGFSSNLPSTHLHVVNGKDYA
jgi:hypothetical protein